MVYDSLEEVCDFFSDSKWIDVFRFWVEGVCLTLFSLLAIITNIISIIVFVRRKIKNSFDGFILVLAVIDALFCLFTMVDLSFVRVFNMNGIVYTFLFPWFLYPITNSLLCASIYMTVLLGLERFIAVCFPYYHRNLTLSKMFKYRVSAQASLVILFSLLLNVPKFFETTITSSSSPDGDLRYSIEFTSFSNNPHYIRYYNTITQTLITGVIPFLALLFFNIRIYIRLRQTRNRFLGNRQTTSAKEAKDFQLAFVLVGIVCVFLLTNSLRLFLNVYEWTYVDTMIRCKEKFRPSSWIILTTIVSHLLLILNGGNNFLMYCILNRNMRTDILKLFRISHSQILVSGAPDLVEMNKFVISKRKEVVLG